MSVKPTVISSTIAKTPIYDHDETLDYVPDDYTNASVQKLSATPLRQAAIPPLAVDNETDLTEFTDSTQPASSNHRQDSATQLGGIPATDRYFQLAAHCDKMHAGYELI